MRNDKFCICGNKAVRYGLCDECIYLLRAKRSKSIAIVEKFRDDYNKTHNRGINRNLCIINIFV